MGELGRNLVIIEKGEPSYSLIIGDVYTEDNGEKVVSVEIRDKDVPEEIQIDLRKDDLEKMQSYFKYLLGQLT